MRHAVGTTPFMRLLILIAAVAAMLTLSLTFVASPLLGNDTASADNHVDMDDEDSDDDDGGSMPEGGVEAGVGGEAGGNDTLVLVGTGAAVAAAGAGAMALRRRRHES